MITEIKNYKSLCKKNETLIADTITRIIIKIKTKDLPKWKQLKKLNKRKINALIHDSQLYAKNNKDS
jgi:hypothetical protein